MGTGGTLPTNITQRVTLYNTTGVIEKDKGIYFCPFIRTNFPTPVFQRWLTAFHNIVDTNDSYKNIPISQWSPQDRSLTIKGNVDDFRLITEEGESFNYLIVIRSVRTNNVTLSHFYAFFITDVQQVGNGSVRLELEPDDFTNVFYLHNRKPCNSYEGYYVDVFNEHMKNCYVARQHYNRVKETAKPLSYEDNDVGYEGNPTVIDINLYSEITELSNYRGKLDITNISLRDVSHHFDITDDITKQELTLTENGYVLHLELAYYFQDEQLSINLQLQSYYAEEDNLPIFSQIEEGFKYKRQYRDYKEFINYGNPLTEEEKQAYEEAESWNDLSSELKVKAIELSLAFIHFTINNNYIVLRWSSGTDFINKMGNKLPNVKAVEEKLLTFELPIYNRQDFLKKFETEILDIFNNHFVINYYVKLNGNIYSGEVDAQNSANLLTDAFEISEMLLSTKSLLNEYVLSSYISKESTLFSKLHITDNEISVNIANNLERFTEEEIINYKLVEGHYFCDVNYVSNPADVLESIMNGTTLINTLPVNSWDDFINKWKLEYGGSSSPLLHSSNAIRLMFLEGLEPIKFNLNLDDSEVSKDLKTEYFDTVLTFNPYSFYSVSYLGRVEVPLNKLNYYEKPNFTCMLSIHITDVFKYSFTPIYELGGKSYYYYTEGLDQTINNQVTFLTSRYVDYIIANHSQMKNQYAVNDLNHEYGLISTVVSGVGNIGSGIGKGAILESAISGLAGVGALTGAVQTATGLIGEGLDWSRDTKQIAMNQKAKLADMGNLPSNLKQVGTDIAIDLAINELGLYLNHYTIDELSYNSICKYLERFGYVVNIYDSLNVNTRKGWDFVQLKSFDYEAQITVEQEEKIRQIFANGVTLLHDKSFMVSGHNYEIILD